MAPASLDRCRAVPGDDRHGLPGDRADQEGQAAIRQRALGRKLINGAFEAPKWRTYRAEMRAAKVGHLCKRSEEHTSELQSLMRISYAVFCLKKKKTP